METVIHEQGVVVIELGRSYDATDDGPLRRFEVTLREATATLEAPVVLIDMSRTTTINSSFIGLLFAVGKELRARKGQLALCAADAFCSDVMRVVRLNQMFATYPTRQEALEALSQDGATDPTGKKLP